MERGTVLNSNRNNIWEYTSGEWRDRYSVLHPAFVSQYLIIGQGLEISRSELAATYLEWMQIQFDPILVDQKWAICTISIYAS